MENLEELYHFLPNPYVPNMIKQDNENNRKFCSSTLKVLDDYDKIES